MITFQVTAADPSDLRDQLRNVLAGAIPPPGYAIPPGSLAAAESHWERAKQMGFQQGYQQALRDQSGPPPGLASMGGVGAQALNPVYPRPPGMAADYPQAPGTGDAEVENQVGPGPDFEEVAERNRKVSVAVAQKREEYYASMSAPEMVARTLKQQHHDHIGPTD